MDSMPSSIHMDKKPPVAPPLQCTQGWQPVLSLIQAVDRYSRAHIEELRRVLRNSDSMLAPLCDPLRSRLGMHRWLAPEREESYSDWLQWVIEQLTVRQICDLCEILPDTLPCDPSKKPDAVKREFVVERGRIDIVVDIGDQPWLVIEVKKTSQQDARTDKQARYTIGLHRRLLVLPGVTDRYREAPTGGFVPLLWSDFCIHLRKLLLDPQLRDQENGIVRRALIVAFIGAVEQNLLGFVSPEADCGESLRYASTAKHVMRALL